MPEKTSGKPLSFARFAAIAAGSLLSLVLVLGQFGPAQAQTGDVTISTESDWVTFVGDTSVIGDGDSIIFDGSFVVGADLGSMTPSITGTIDITSDGTHQVLDGADTYSLLDLTDQEIGTVSDLTFQNADKTGAGAALYTAGDLESILDSSFLNNQASTTGGAVYIGGDVTGGLSNVNASGNIAQAGGFMYVVDNILGDVSGNFTGHEATAGNGGVFYVEGYVQADFNDVNASYNTAEAGGFLAVDGNFTGDINGGNYTANEATDSTDGFGGAYNIEGNFTGDVTGVLAVNNTAVTGGGFMYVGDNFTGNIVGGNYTDNSALDPTDGTGGAYYIAENFNGTVNGVHVFNNTAAQGGFMAVRENFNGSIIGGNYTSNNATGDYGGVYHLTSFNGSVSGVNATGNVAEYNGGFMYVENNFNGTISGGNYIGNNATLNGGGVYYIGGDFAGSINDVFAANNTAGGGSGAFMEVLGSFDGSINNGNYSNHQAMNGAGGAYHIFEDFNGSINNVNAFNNTASGNGGFMTVDGDAYGFNGTISGGNYTSNQALGAGDGYILGDGGAYYIGADFNGSVSGVLAVSNTANMSGGFMYVANDFTGSISGGNYTGNKALNLAGGAYAIIGAFNGSVNNVLAVNNTAALGGGFMYVAKDFNGSISGGNYTGNQATSDGTNPGNGGAYFIGGDFNGSVVNVLAVDNSANQSGGFMAVHNGFNGTISGVQARNNTAMFGGFMYVGNDYNASITNSLFAGNQATNGSGGAIAVGGNFSAPLVNNTVFHNNKALYEGDDDGTMGYGGAIFAFDSITNTTFNSTSFIGNEATFDSGAIYAVNGFNNTVFQNTLFENNTAGRNGGALFLQDGEFDAVLGENVVFRDNQAGEYGGAVFSNGSITLGLSDRNFTGNTAGLDGGGLYVNGSLTGPVNNTWVTGNEATTGSGGGIYVSGSIYDTVVNASNFTGNRAGMHGGAMFARGGYDNVTFTNNRFIGNSAGWDGGALYFDDPALDVAFKNNTFIGNTAGLLGGAIYFNGGDLYLEDTGFIGNAAGALGGAVFVTGANDANITIATSGERTFAYFLGNSDNNTGEPVLNSIAVGTGDYLATGNVALNMTGNGYIGLIDPINVRTAGSFEFNRNTYDTDDSTLFWGGQNIVSAGDGAQVTLDRGTTFLVANYQLTGDPNAPTDNMLDVTFGDEFGEAASSILNLGFLYRDNPTTSAYFDFTNSNNASDLTVYRGTTKITVAQSDYTQRGRYLFIDASNLDQFNVRHKDFLSDAGAMYWTRVHVLNNAQQVWLNVDPTPARPGKPNAARAYSALQQWFFDTEAGLGTYGREFDAIWRDVDSATPEGAVTMGLIAVDLHDWARYMALNHGFGSSFSARTPFMTAGFNSRATSTLNTALTSNMFRGGSPESSRYEGGAGISNGAFNLRSNMLADQPSLIDSYAPAYSANKNRFMTASLDRSIPDNGSDSGSYSTDSSLIPGYGLKFWTAYLGSYFDADSKGGYSGYTVKTNGVLAGFSWDINSAWSVGGWGGYAYSDVDFSNIDTDIDTDAGHFGLYGRYIAPFGLKIAADMAYSRFSNDMTRSVGNSRSHKASFDQDVFTIGLNFSYDWKPWENGVVTPFVHLSQTWMRQDDLSEDSGYMSTDMEGLHNNNFALILGASIAHDFILSEKVMLTPNFTAAWKHDFGDTTLSSRANYNAPLLDGSSPIVYDVDSRSVSPNAVILDVGLDALFKTDSDLVWGLKATYGLELRNKEQDHAVFVGAEIRF